MTSPPYIARDLPRPYRKIVRTITGPEHVELEFKGFRLRRREYFCVLLLNARNESMRREIISIGSLNASVVHPREVFRPAVRHAAAAIICVHNHPSGDPDPSEEDLDITRRLIAASEILGISMLDHVIIAQRGTVSLRTRLVDLWGGLHAPADIV